MDVSSLNELDGPYFVEKVTPLPQAGTIVNKKYRLEETIANTNCSVVFLGSNIDTNEKVAIKFIKRRVETFENIKNEIGIQLILSNKLILKIEDYFPYFEYVCIVTKYAIHGSLHDFITKNYRYGIPESIASVIMNQILKSIEYLHNLGIAHRDIKPDNFLVIDSNPDHPKIVLSDFGFAKFFNEGEVSTEYKGTPNFIAPEIIARIPYSFSVDIWSLGVTMFFILTAINPFPSFNVAPKDCIIKILKGHLNYGLLYAMKISEDAINLIKKMCTVALKKRISIENALAHPWIMSNQKQTDDEFEIENALYQSDEYQFESGF